MPPTTFAIDENVADATKNDHVIVFDRATKTISSDKRSNLRGVNAYSRYSSGVIANM